jgi:hypothetical protein
VVSPGWKNEFKDCPNRRIKFKRFKASIKKRNEMDLHWRIPKENETERCLSHPSTAPEQVEQRRLPSMKELAFLCESRCCKLFSSSLLLFLLLLQKSFSKFYGLNSIFNP